MLTGTSREISDDSEIASVLSDHAERFSIVRQHLTSILQAGVSSAQFHLYRDNYLYRTSTTTLMLSVLLHNLLSRADSDHEVVKMVARTLNDEIGLTDDGPPHREMLEKSHNFHGFYVYDLAPVSLKDIDTSSLILPAIRDYRLIQSELYSSDTLLLAMGAYVAQESAAQSMLQLFYDVFFAPCKALYEKDGDFTFAKVSGYFEAHLGGVEELHAANARTCALRMCESDDDVVLLKSGMTRFIDAQMRAWGELSLALGKNTINHGWAA